MYDPRRHFSREAFGPVIVTIASCRQPLLAALHATLAQALHARVTDCVSEPLALFTQLAQRPPDVLIIDKLLLDGLAPRSARAIHEAALGVRVLVACDVMHDALGDDVLRARFHGFVLNDSSPATWAKAIGEVRRGGFWLPRAMLEKALSDTWQQAGGSDAADNEGPTAAGLAGLTRRETQIVEHLRQGLTNKEIASRLGIREDTVKKHLHSVFGKLGVRRRALLVLGRLPGQERPHASGADCVRPIP